MKQVTFELLRHGPPNNQLLSPLTQYLALCQNHPATTLQIPFEHNAFLHRLRALSYQLGNESRAFQVKDTAQVLGDLLGRVPGLVAEMNRDEYSNDVSARGAPRREPNRTAHLRMIFSASELALLPFELALSPPGFPGAGQPLLLQFQDPICMTREVRRVAEHTLTWPKKPKLLFIAASPGDVGQIPFEQHLVALKSLLEPWVDYTEPDVRRFEDHLVVLRNATCGSIEEACAQNQFTHVHILAHGIEYYEGYDIRHGLALHDPMNPNGPADTVSGERLATALRAVQTSGNRRLSRPSVVTIASCDSGNQGGVVGLGGSVAFALHQAEIPIVVASQFPLSVAASLIFVRVLYEALLWGQDPRLALNDLRRRLHTLYPTTHDWASVTAYVALPENFENWLVEGQRSQTVRSMDVAMKFADFVTEQVSPKSEPDISKPRADEVTHEVKVALLHDATTRMDDGRRRLEEMFKYGTGDRSQLAGKLAATEKRCAEAYFYFSREDPTNAQSYTEKWQRLLQQSRQHYWNVFELSRDQAWAVVQFLSLDIVLRRLFEPLPGLVMERHEDHNKPEALWNLAHVLSINDLRSRNDQLRQWALGNLVELYLLALLMDPDDIHMTSPDLQENAEKRALDLVDLVGSESFEIYATRRQIMRYFDWYSRIADMSAITASAGEIIKVLPVAGL